MPTIHTYRSFSEFRNFRTNYRVKMLKFGGGIFRDILSPISTPELQQWMMGSNKKPSCRQD